MGAFSGPPKGLRQFKPRCCSIGALAIYDGWILTDGASPMQFGEPQPVAQINEVLVKILCHNIVVLVQSMFELGVMPVFWAEGLLEQNGELFQKSA